MTSLVAEAQAPRAVTQSAAVDRRLHDVPAREREDFARFLVEAGLSHEQVHEASHNEADQTGMPAGFDHFTLGPSRIEGSGLFTCIETPAGAVIGPARIGEKRTPLGRF